MSVVEQPTAEADEFEIPSAPVAARKKIVIPPPPRSSLTVREPSDKAAGAELSDASEVAGEPDEFAPPPPPSAKPKNRLVRQSLPAWQRPPAVRR
jgi:hypothetical protein